MTRLRNHLAGQSIDSQIAPSAITYKKIIYRLKDLPVAPAGFKEINLGSTEEVRIYSDFPVDIKLGDSHHIEKSRTDLIFRGKISRIQVASRLINLPGALVIYVGDPYLGVDWERESFDDKGSLVVSSAPTINAGLSDVDAGLSSVFSFAGNSFGLEASYIHSISFSRTVGNIEKISFIDSETGASVPVFNHTFRNPVSADTLRFVPPKRISARGDFKFYGSIEAVNSDVDIDIELGFI